ncbi:hypothetical protein [Candidatus Blastococcus massiliensis]|uniref:hypothetical protein n=1 Tax=Candidatus Blastococcus massiliensis TaxID=1470358 RepID=UPI00141259E6|nr:hypothetical protein [Candidatus Blastococcus massiliensis]
MSEPSTQRPVPGPPRPGPPPPAADSEARTGVPQPPADPASPDRFGDLEQRPVADHVAVYEAEHERLQRELGTIDRL